jgi:alginate O-acetyltransferase complex protein AlgF
MRQYSATLALWGLGATLAFAQQAPEGLYAPDPPPNSAFVRLINATPTSLSTQLGAVRVTAETLGASPYVVVPQGSVELQIGKTPLKINVQAGLFYSVTASGPATSPRLKLLEDASSSNRAKALIAVYNLSSLASVDVKTANGKQAVIEAVAPGTTKSRAVNGIKAELAVFYNAQVVAAFRAVQLNRGAAYAVIVSDASGKPQARWLESSTVAR